MNCRKKTIFYLLVASVLHCNICHSQRFCNYIAVSIPRHLDTSSYEYTIGWRSINKNGEFNSFITSKTKLIGRMTGCKGAMNFELIDSENNLHITGKYRDGVKSWTSHVTWVDPIDNSEGVEYQKHYKAIPTGIWLYENLKGEMLFKKKW